MRRAIFASALVVALAGGVPARSGIYPEEGDGFQLDSSSFHNGGLIPAQYTCGGEDISPPLFWRFPPAGTQTVALIVEDLDAAGWVHWVIYNVSPSAGRLPEGFPREPELPGGERQGVTGFRRVGYNGPCPPSGSHRYRFALFALSSSLPLGPRASAGEVKAAMEGLVLGEARLTGTYAK